MGAEKILTCRSYSRGREGLTASAYFAFQVPVAALYLACMLFPDYCAHIAFTRYRAVFLPLANKQGRRFSQFIGNEGKVLAVVVHVQPSVYQARIPC